MRYTSYHDSSPDKRTLLKYVVYVMTAYMGLSTILAFMIGSTEHTLLYLISFLIGLHLSIDLHRKKI